MQKLKLAESVKRDWVAALRSGEFRQGWQSLRQDRVDGKAYCCLGVLCELAARAGVGSWGSNNKFIDPETTYAAVDVLPSNVAAWAFGIDRSEATHTRHKNPELHTLNKYGNITWTSLAHLNDGSSLHQRRNFTQIADLIDEHF